MLPRNLAEAGAFAEVSIEDWRSAVNNLKGKPLAKRMVARTNYGLELQASTRLATGRRRATRRVFLVFFRSHVAHDR